MKLLVFLIAMGVLSLQNLLAVKETHREFIYEKAPFPSCHASTICETTDGTLVSAWFGGTHEKHKDVAIYFSTRANGKWTEPREIANGIEPNGDRHPTWNPVLFQAQNGPLLLFYRVGPSPSQWWTYFRTSNNNGKTWSAPKKLPDGFLGPIKNKPVQLPDGSILHGSSTEQAGWKVHMERSFDRGTRWEKTGPLSDAKEFGAIQPTILVHSPQNIQILCRTSIGWIGECTSKDLGKTWSPMKKLKLPNPNSGIDAVKLSDGRSLLVYNNTAKGRSPLNVAVSKTGAEWENVLALETEPGEFSYPAIIQSKDGTVSITYTWNRKKIRYVTVDVVSKPVK